ncbi:MAG: DNA polymerase III subunit delta [Chloroflexi bacterium]|nr:DNA polymerase III subunit delta [Chloroflexota bacterium]
MVKYVDMLHILYGEDDFSRREALHAIKQGLGEAQLLDSNTTLLDGSQLTLEQLRSACDALPFFTAHRLVIVEGLLQRYETRPARQGEKRRPAPGQETELPRRLAAYMPLMPPSTTTVLTDGKLSEGNQLLKMLAPLASVAEFKALRGEKLHSWIQQRVEAKQGRMTPGAVRKLAEMAGDSLWAVDSEIDKLLLYSRGPAISESEVREALAHSREANEFAMMDAIMASQVGTAQTLLHRRLDEGSKAPQVIGFMVRQLALILRAKEAMEKGLDHNAVRAMLGIKEFAAGKVMRQAKGATYERITAMYHRLLEADLAVKRGFMADELALDLMVAEMCRR